MTSPAMKLDTLAYAKKLIAAGCTPQLAEAHASAQQDVLVDISEDYFSQFATKQDLDAHRIATKHDLDDLRTATKHDLDELRTATKHDLDDLRTATKHDLDELRTATKHDLDELRTATKHDFIALEQRIEKKMVSLAFKMTTILGGLVVTGVIVLAAIIKL